MLRENGKLRHVKTDLARKPKTDALNKDLFITLTFQSSLTCRFVYEVVFLQSGKFLIQNFFHPAKQVLPQRPISQNPQQHNYSKMWSSAISSQLLMLVTLISLFRESVAYFVTVRFLPKIFQDFKIPNLSSHQVELKFLWLLRTISEV